MSIVDRIDPAFGHWLAGFTDGEGCFYITSRHSRVRGVHYVSYQCAFCISLRDDDRRILEQIRDTLEMGHIATRAPRSIGKWPMAALTILRKADAMQLVEFFDAFPPRAKKARDYAIWREAAVEWSTKRRGGEKGRLGAVAYDWTRMAELHQALKDIRRYQPPDA